MKILVLGSGAREHAIVGKLLTEPQVGSVYCAPGNIGISRSGAECFDLDILNKVAVVNLAKQLKPDLVVIGPEAPLVLGIADALRASNFLVFGPNQGAAQIEGSKEFAKQIMKHAKVPTARSFSCITKDELISALNEFDPPYVVKDDGLAAGKGVVVTKDKVEALNHGLSCLEVNSKVLVEEYLAGPEISVFCITDGKTVYPMLPAQDFKRIFDNDLGPNTGGMGAYSPLSWTKPDLLAIVKEQIAQPVINALREQGNSFCGVLYCGLVLTDSGLKVIEFNARFGDPETQVVLALLDSSLAELLHHAASGTLNQIEPPVFKSGAAVTVVMASDGYPASKSIGDPISGIEDELINAQIHHAGTKVQGVQIVTNGGRVLAITAYGSNLTEARSLSYQAVSRIKFRGAQFRTDIALKAANDESDK
jgi:phosphoribosylamine--glycine ligase